MKFPGSKVTARPDTQTDTHTHIDTMKTLPLPHMRDVITMSNYLCNYMKILVLKCNGAVYNLETVSNGLLVYLGYVYVLLDSENFRVAKLVSNG